MVKLNGTLVLVGAGKMGGAMLEGWLAGGADPARIVALDPAPPPEMKELLQRHGIRLNPAVATITDAEVVILAVPDTAIGKVAEQVVPLLAPGTMVVCLDAAAPFAGHLPQRADLTYFVTHPCHPPIFNDEITPEGKRDFFGGVAAKQGIVNALMQGPEAHYALGEAVGKAIYAPVVRSHRVTVEQMAILEPGLSETVCASLLAVMREAMDEAVARGVPKEAAILAAVIFNEIPGAFSDACNKAIEFGKPRLMRDDWLNIFDTAEISDSIERIT